jgi:hypothetical protein
MGVSDQELQALVEAWRANLEKQMADMKLRQWCVEQSIKYAIAGRFTLPDDILKFITAPFADAFRDGAALP